MNDLMAKLQDLLSSTEGQESLKQIAGMLGGQNSQLNLGAISSMLGQNGNQNGNENTGRSSDQNQGGPDLSGIDLNALVSMLGQNGNSNGDLSSGQDQGGSNSGGLDLGGLDIGSLIKVQNILSNMKRDDKNTALIRALRPHLKKERQHRVDEALRLMQLASLLPTLRESGILGKLFGGD
jgi:hypothetical protein